MGNPTRRLFLTVLATLSASVALAQGPSGKAEPEGKPKPDDNKIRRPIATLETAKGKIVILLYPEEAPKTVENFVTLAKKGFYNGLKFHRVEKDFVIQGGDPEGNGTGGPGYVIKNEANKKLRHNRGAVAMANAGRDTAGSQFYIVISKPASFLDEKYEDGVNKYTLFGQVIVGQDVAEKIAKDDKIVKVTVRP